MSLIFSFIKSGIFARSNYYKMNYRQLLEKNNIQKAKKLIYHIYEIATAEPPNSLYINLFTNDINKMFMKNLNAYLQIVD